MLTAPEMVLRTLGMPVPGVHADIICGHSLQCFQQMRLGDSFRRRHCEDWNACTGECTHTSSGHGACVISAVFSADGATAMTASKGGAAKIRNACTVVCRRTSFGHEWLKFSAAFQRMELRCGQRPKTALQELECLRRRWAHISSGHGTCVMTAVFFFLFFSRWSYGADSSRRRHREDLECL